MRHTSEYENESDRRREKLVNKINRLVYLFIFAVFGLNIINANALAKNTDDTTPTLDRGVDVFIQRCSLCHGSQGMGEGKIPLKIPNYPNTNLVKSLKASTPKEIYETIVYGGMLEGISNYMPPMGNELTWTEMESVSMFIQELRQNTEKMLGLVATYQNTHSVATNLGKQVYEARCVLCHGIDGLGDGRMSKIIKDPPPFNLTISAAPKFYIKDIIGMGGEAMGRSAQMPPWGDQLAGNEIEAVVDYVMALRTKN